MAAPAASVGPVVVNRHHYHGKALPAPFVYIGRGTPLGNPYTKQDHGADAVRLYEIDLRQRIEDRDPEVLAALNAITPEHHLGCSCKPAPCHGDVVLAEWEWLAGKGEW